MGSLEGQELVLPFSPKQPELGTYNLRMTATIYIDRSDSREVGDDDVLRLSPGATVGLLQVPYPIRAVSYSKDPVTHQVTEICAELVKAKDSPKPRAFIHWTPEGSRKVTVRIHKLLFKSDNPMAAEGGFLADVNTNSEEIYDKAPINARFDEMRRRALWPPSKEKGASANGPEGVRFQAMRVAYFAMDADSTEESIVLNQIVSLKKDSKKEARK